MHRTLYFFLILLFLGDLSYSFPPPNKDKEVKIQYSVFLLGDAGEPYIGDLPHMELLKNQIHEAGSRSTILYLGDNIYPKGLPPAGHKLRAEAEQSLRGQLEILKGYEGRVVFIAGNHDWEKGGKKGWEYVLNQQTFIENYLDSIEVFLPGGGCPGPEEIPLTEDLTLVIMDSQWLLHPWDKPGLEDGCQGKNTVKVLELLEDILQRNESKKVVVAMHHPLFTYGIHGGYATFNDHLFPLTAANDKLYLPLPVIGSIYPFYRKYIGSRQDVTYPKYTAIRNFMEGMFNQYPGLIHVSGHEHSFQHNLKDSIHYIVSGSGSKTTHVKDKGYAQFVAEKTGFSRIDFYSDGLVKLQFWSAQNDPLGEIIYEKELYKKVYDPPITGEEFSQLYHLKDSMITISASQQYLIKPKKYKWFGENYRKIWATEITVPVFDIGSEHGGLTIIKRGGGLQTNSLRLEAPSGKQYVLRSIEKYAIKAVPEPLRETFAANLVQDQISASHPYGAFVVPKLAENAEVYHTNPKVVYVPDDPRLGNYRADFANGLFLYEERPDDDWRDADFFGNSKEIISTSKLLEALYKDNDNYVDQNWVLKSRLFDLLIGDWDRHDDQWRWSSFKVKGDKGKYYRPIPRDRDQAFFVNNGFFMSIAKKKWALPKFQGFDYELKYPPGFMFNARYFDRDFLNEPDQDEWISEIEKLQVRMTDGDIEKAFDAWPKKVKEQSGDEIIAKLKYRRDNLKRFALEHYEFLSRDVNVRGSNKRELFRIERNDNENTRVRVYKISKKNNRDKMLFERNFKTKETDEIRLYGFAGDDEFEVTGAVKKSPLIRIIGGEGEDLVVDQSKVGGLAHKTHVYDTKSGNKLELGSESRNRTSKNPEVNAYNRKEFKYNTLIPLIIGNFNPDDGFFIGGGFFSQVHGFRKDPFKSSHLLLGSLAFRTISWDFKYHGRFTDVIGPLDVKLNVDALAPNYVTNFFGLGNETEFNQAADQIYTVDKAIDYYRTRFEAYSVETFLVKKFGTRASFGFGPHWQGFEVEDNYDGEDRFVLDFADSLSGEDSARFFDFKTYAGFVLQFEYDSRDNNKMPLRGMLFNLDLRGYNGLNNASEEFTRFRGDVSFYHTFRIPGQVTLALRGGGGHNFGNYEFFQAQVIDGVRQLRGFRKTRFFGDSKVFGNTEVRMRLASLRNRIVPLTIGINGFYDVGRVWLEGESSNTLHQGYGGGIWFAPLNLVPISFEMATSDEGTLFYFRLGFLF